jgi:hypothetical protein
MTTDVVAYQPPRSAIQEQMDYARAVAAKPQDGAARSLLPDAYRENPANVMIAIGLGSAMGLSYAESLYRIDVIKGKPSASAELITANVRKAGHKLRIKVTENPPTATCTITRADDPDEPITITRDMAWAQRMGLANEPNYKKQPATMLGYRAITACARLACSEALYGVAYTPDEMREVDDGPRVTATVEAPQSGVDRMRAIVTPQPLPTEPEEAPTPPEVKNEDKPDWDEPPMTDQQRRAMFGNFGKLNIGAADTQRDYIAASLDRPVKSRGDLTMVEAETVLSQQQADLLLVQEPTDA